MKVKFTLDLTRGIFRLAIYFLAIISLAIILPRVYCA
jgi:hypothetical protein